MLRVDQVAERVTRKFHPRLSFAVGRRRRNSVRQGIDRDDAVLVRVDQFSGVGRFEVELARRSARPCQVKNDIRSVGVNRAENAIAEFEIADGLAAFEFEITEFGEPLILGTDNSDAQDNYEQGLEYFSVHSAK